MSELKDLSVLIVEDDEGFLEILSDFFRYEGSRVFQARNGQEALTLMGTTSVHFVISDIQMPVMTGIELLEKIRAIDPQIPVVLLATGQSKITDAEAKSKGALGLILKPFDFESLKEIIKNAFA